MRERALLVHHNVIVPAEKKGDLEWYSACMVKWLGLHGSRTHPPVLACRIFCWALQSTTTQATWSRCAAAIQKVLPDKILESIKNVNVGFDFPGLGGIPVDSPKPAVAALDSGERDGRKLAFFTKLRKQRKEKEAAAAAAQAHATKPVVEEKMDATERQVRWEQDRVYFFKRQLKEAIDLVCTRIIRLLCKEWKRWAAELPKGTVPEDCVITSPEMQQEMEVALVQVVTPWIMEESRYDQKVFEAAIVEAVTKLLLRNGIKHHGIFARERIPELIHSRAFGCGKSAVGFEDFSATPFKKAFFFWPVANLIPSASSIHQLSEDFLSSNPVDALINCSPSLCPSFGGIGEGPFQEFCGFQGSEASLSSTKEMDVLKRQQTRFFQAIGQGGS